MYTHKHSVRCTDTNIWYNLSPASAPIAFPAKFRFVKNRCLERALGTMSAKDGPKGKERKGKERKGKERTGKEWNGKVNKIK